MNEVKIRQSKNTLFKRLWSSLLKYIIDILKYYIDLTLNKHH